MIDLERRLSERFPRWFEGARAPWGRRLVRALAWLGKLDAINEWLAANAHRSGFDFIEHGLDYLGVRYTVDPVERARIPAQGRLLIIANHPLGALDSLALLHLVGSVRRDVRILANDFLLEFKGLHSLFLPLRVFGGRPSPESLKAVTEALAAEQAVILFPAGAVARLGWRGIRDGAWRPGFLRFARECAAPVLPVRVEARNSALFYALASLYRPLGTALLPRELFKARGLRIDLRIGLPRQIPPPAEAGTSDGAAADTAALLASMRRVLEAIGTADEQAPPDPAPLAHPVERAALRAEVMALRELGSTPDGKQIRVGRLSSDSLLLRELGRLRELSFRTVGGGTRRAIDVDAYDTWYEHIVLWDAEAWAIAGAYRVCRGAEVLETRGLAGLYTASLFEYAPPMLAHLAEGMELGRSFVTPEYWGTRSLDYLWLGIGAYLRAHPELRYLFGPVSISGSLPTAAREHLVAYYSQHFGLPTALEPEAATPAGEPAAAPMAEGVLPFVRARRPFRFHAEAPCYRGLDAEQSFKVLKKSLDALGAKVPVLYKQYTELCEPGGARFLAFGVDPSFSNSVVGMIELDLRCIKPKKLQRYITGADGDLAPPRDPAQPEPGDGSQVAA
ncbi:MAG: lysophospholipid acyltransferase family protein [Xanthomonadaceae bacterium]|nr:lysophospholipid acyltransferase family protein [Xanthomonadaceae bacterium]